MDLPPHPMQPVYLTEGGIARFRKNDIVRFLIDFATGKGVSMNELALMPFSREDREQFAQLIGYSVSGFGDLSYASDEVVTEADGRVADLLDRSRKDGAA